MQGYAEDRWTEARFNNYPNFQDVAPFPYTSSATYSSKVPYSSSLFSYTANDDLPLPYHHDFLFADELASQPFPYYEPSVHQHSEPSSFVHHPPSTPSGWNNVSAPTRTVPAKPYYYTNQSTYTDSRPKAIIEPDPSLGEVWTYLAFWGLFPLCGLCGMHRLLVGDLWGCLFEMFTWCCCIGTVAWALDALNHLGIMRLYAAGREIPMFATAQQVERSFPDASPIVE